MIMIMFRTYSQKISDNQVCVCVKSQGVGVKKSCEELVQRVNEMLSRVYTDSPPMLVRMPNTLAYGKPEYLNWSFFCCD